jgi:hypothetical protein
MLPSEVLRFRQARPFIPFRIKQSSGEQYDVTHPELCMVGRTFVHVGLPDNPMEPTVAGRLATVALVHIDELIPLTPGLVD